MGTLEIDADLHCVACGSTYERVEGTPVLIDRDVTLFDPPDSVSSEAGSALGSRLGALLPALGSSRGSAPNFERLAALLGQMPRERPRVLVVGGRILGAGMEPLLAANLELVETDVALGPRSEIVCDAQRLPFADETFDAVVVQAVLASVPDVEQAVNELHRVLADGGLVYAEDAFIQQVWGGRFDFHRWTPLGHRRLFRRFEEVDSGIVDGPGTALAWSWHYFVLSFGRSRRTRKALQVAGRLSGFWLKYFDRVLRGHAAAFDAASGVYFLGRKSEHTVSDRELVAGYRGMVGS
jgi:SAM-dependent methyltransferase